MKKILLTVAATLFNVFILFAQEDSSLVDFYKGGFIHFTAGAVNNNSFDLKSVLNNGTPFGDQVFDFKNVNTGWAGGLSTMFIFDRGVMLGARGEYTMITSQSNPAGKVNLSGLSTELTLGKIIYNNSRTFIYPYLGIGFHKYFMNIQNTSADRGINFDVLDVIKPKDKAQTYTSNSPIFELGMGIKRAFSEKFAMGIELGGYFSSTTHSSFSRNGKSLDYREAPGVNGAFVRLTFDIIRYGKRAYIDTSRRVVAVKTPVVGENKAPQPAKPPEEAKPAEKKAKKKSYRKTDPAKAASQDSSGVKATAPEETPHMHIKVADPNKKSRKPEKRSGSDSKNGEGKKNYNDQLFNFGSQPAPAPKPKAGTPPVSPKDNTKPADSTQTAPPDTTGPGTKTNPKGR